MNPQTKKLLNEISCSPHKELEEVREKIEIVQEEGLNLIKAANKEKNSKKSAYLFSQGDSLIEKLTKACMN